VEHRGWYTSNTYVEMDKELSGLFMKEVENKTRELCHNYHNQFKLERLYQASYLLLQVC
jgi:hypothetical protein